LQLVDDRRSLAWLRRQGSGDCSPASAPAPIYRCSQSVGLEMEAATLAAASLAQRNTRRAQSKFSLGLAEALGSFPMEAKSFRPLYTCCAVTIDFFP
jgi:hypothetical protein